ncbi:MAG TPA: putative DNA base hypermodification protein [Candidatus Obscuribacter sp.]|nr:putative DNA base hypermodification protein [Candidatus Obscuribacter sp.]
MQLRKPVLESSEIVETREFRAMVKRARPKPTVVFQSYWEFAAERQNIFFKRMDNTLGPWTDNPILRQYKFTNAFRVSDRVSQFLVSNVIYSGSQAPEDLLYRIMLFKLFNKIETWEMLEREIGELTWASHNFQKLNTALTKAIEGGKTIYSSAYIMPSGSSSFGSCRKHENHLRLIELMMKDRLWEKMQAATSMEAAYKLILSYPTIGSFLAYQYLIDLNYSNLTLFDEMEFVVPGPGARDGIAKCFSDRGGYSESDIIQMMAETQDEHFDKFDLKFKDLFGRKLQLIDCQNLFCEIDKYSRVAHPEVAGLSGRTRIKQSHRPRYQSIAYKFPPKWNLSTR